MWLFSRGGKASKLLGHHFSDFSLPGSLGQTIKLHNKVWLQDGRESTGSLYLELQ